MIFQHLKFIISLTITSAKCNDEVITSARIIVEVVTSAKSVTSARHIYKPSVGEDACGQVLSV